MGVTQELVRGRPGFSLSTSYVFEASTLLLISKSDRGGEVQPIPGHGHSPEQPASVKPEWNRQGPRGPIAAVQTWGPQATVSVLLWAVMRGKNENGWRSREGGELRQHPPSGHLACFLPPNSFINIMAKSDPTNLPLRKWQWLPNA